MSTSRAPRLTLDLVSGGLQQLTRLRSSAMAAVVKELQSTLPDWMEATERGQMPAGAPKWMVSCFTAAALPGGGVCWETIQGAFARQTTMIIEEASLSEHVTGTSLARFLRIDLEEFAREGWSGIEQRALTLSKKEAL